MTISIPNAINTILSENYNKKYIGIFWFFLLLFPILSYLMTIFTDKWTINIPMILLIQPFILFIFLYIAGTITLANHNAIYGEKSVFLDFSHIVEILLCGVKFILGHIILLIVAIFALAGPMITLGTPGLILSTCVGIILFLVYIGLSLNLYYSLALEDLLNVSKSVNFIKKSYPALLNYVFVLILAFIVFLVTIYIISSISKQIIAPNLQFFVVDCGFNSIIAAALIIILIEINAQFVRAVLKTCHKQ